MGFNSWFKGLNTTISFTALSIQLFLPWLSHFNVIITAESIIFYTLTLEWQYKENAQSPFQLIHFSSPQCVLCMAPLFRPKYNNNNNNNNNNNISVMELGHLLTRSDLTYPEVSSKVCHDSFCQLGNSVSLPWVIYYGAFYLHVVSSFSCIPVICLKLVLFLIPLQFVHLFCNQYKCILLFFSCISSLLLLFFWHPLL